MISIDAEVDQTDASQDYASRIQALTVEIQQSSGDNARLQLNLGHAYKARGDLALAIAAYQVVAQDPIEKSAVTGLWKIAGNKQRQ